jgi:hypothetical protein
VTVSLFFSGRSQNCLPFFLYSGKVCTADVKNIRSQRVFYLFQMVLTKALKKYIIYDVKENRSAICAFADPKL